MADTDAKSPQVVPTGKHSRTRSAATAVADPPEVDVEPALARIAEMTSLPTGWDGEDATPPTGSAVAEACRLIVAVAARARRTAGKAAVPWTSAPIADGGLLVEWLGSRTRIEVQIGPDGDIGYLIKLGEGSAARYEEADDIGLEAMIEAITHIVAS